MNQPNETPTQTQMHYFEDTIDLRPYLIDLLASWKLILGLPALVGVLSVIYFLFLTTPSYEATSLVAVTEASFSVEVTADSRVTTADDLTSSYDAYPELALSDSLVLELYNDPDLLPLWPEAVFDPDELKKRLSANTGSDPSLIRLGATFTDPDLPSLVVNRWAELFINTLNEVYGTSSSGSLTILEDRLLVAEQIRIEAEDDLVEFQGQNNQRILTNQLENFTAAQTEYNRDLQELDRTLVDLFSFQQQIDAGMTDTFNRSTIFLFEIRVYGLNISDRLQFDSLVSDTESGVSALDAGNIVSGLILYVQAQKRILSDELIELEPRILASQRALELAKNQARVLTNRLSLAEDTYNALAAKVEENRVTADVFAGQIRVASTATSSNEVSQGGLTTTLILAVVAGLLTVSCLVLKRWWVDLFVDE